MFSRPPVWLIAAALLAGCVLPAEERNLWPFGVEQLRADGTVSAGEYVGPLFFTQSHRNGGSAEGFRPFYLRTVDGTQQRSSFLYPLFTWQTDSGYRAFSFFQLINFSRNAARPHPAETQFDVWPFYFSRHSPGDPAASYHALFPVVGTIKSRLGFDRLHFVLFPLYLEAEKHGTRTTHAPWPFLRFINGNGRHGFEFWPLFGHQGRAGDYDGQFCLWPLFYRNASQLSKPVPTVKLGVLPFYTRDTAPGFISETYAWPFFGYTHRTEPYRYDEQRYFWPFLVQGKGDQRRVNRWAPFYTHSVIKGYDKTWFVWPFWRHATWTDAGVNQEQNQFFWIVYWSLTQHSVANPGAAPAHKTHLWPLLSSWDNGAGRRQFQLLSPFEVLFPDNAPTRQLWTPLVALYRYDQRAPDDTRASLLFNLVSWKDAPTEKEFHFGPLFSRRTTAARSRVTVGLGLFSWTRPAGAGRWKFSLFDFSSAAASLPADAPSP